MERTKAMHDPRIPTLLADPAPSWEGADELGSGRMSELRLRIARGSYDVCAESVALALWLASQEALQAFRLVEA